MIGWLRSIRTQGRSARQIKPFIKKHHIDMSEFKPVAYRSFAEFFDREFLPDMRLFVSAPDEMAAFAEARYFGWHKRMDPQTESYSSLNQQSLLLFYINKSKE